MQQPVIFNIAAAPRRFIIAGVVILTVQFLLACSSSATSVKSNELTDGRVIYVALEGGFYGIETEKEGHLFPLNLDPAYRKDGLKIRFSYRIVKNAVTAVMWGTPVEIIYIEKK